MSDVTVQGAARTAWDRGTPAPVPFGRLLLVEARKMADTRSAMIMFGLLAAMTVVSIAARGVVAGPELARLTTTAGIGYGTLLPAIAILAVTGDWTHRSALTTFTLEPRRGRVLAARCLPPLAATVVASLFALVVAVPATAVTAAVQGVPAEWDITVPRMLGWTATNVLLIAMAIALAMLLLHPAAAIATYFVLSTLWNLVRNLSETGREIARWVDLGTAVGPLATAELTWMDAARLGTALLCSVALPLAIGVVRALRAEVR
ncbi:hypothetical protein GCM10010106_23870 [Thermopolyspora flexuosa]|jgi:hypothetical protein|uniref:ABC-2 family transporter n=1 Tax=Thermopolyspora flexuosa TaxID=103836 RepID=A0A543IV97_9ACTN|nr:hypothetical protein [Thermopolyspora flexuosa]TQM74503.1 hypothetical protein FHX40_1180 [Thermopolyspora flexuosa]GGM76679.1 hypothetical protein GCM10010106_23870 [Thermopolyspora flexuosa]